MLSDTSEVEAATGVALRKESVDRNSVLLSRFGSSSSRSPQGERG